MKCNTNFPILYSSVIRVFIMQGLSYCRKIFNHPENLFKAKLTFTKKGCHLKHHEIYLGLPDCFTHSLICQKHSLNMQIR